MSTDQSASDALTVVLRGQLAVCRSLLMEADAVLSTLEPESDDEAQRLRELRSEIAQVTEPDTSGAQSDLFAITNEGKAP